MDLTVYQYSQLIQAAFVDKCPATALPVFGISLFVTYPNESLRQRAQDNYTKIEHCILPFVDDANIPKLITSFLRISDKHHLNWQHFNWLDTEYESQVKYSDNNSIVDFSHGINLNVNVRTQTLSKEYFEKYFINIYCVGKGDEMWLGIMSKSSYISFVGVRKHRDGLFYYGGRERLTRRYVGSVKDSCRGFEDDNHGSIQGKDKTIEHPLELYSAGDWIYFEIDLSRREMIFYKNGIKQYQAGQEWFPVEDAVYFMVELDDQVDKFYIEQGFEGQVNSI